MGKCVNSVVVNAPVDKVWAAIRNFHDLSWATGVVEKCEVVGELGGDQIGAKRVLNDAFHETLHGLNDLDHTIQYSIDDGPGPVAKDAIRNYVGHVQLSPITTNDTTYVLWTSSYDSPNDSAVGELCNPVYQALLNALAKHLA
jgi:hypothetical protein